MVDHPYGTPREAHAPEGPLSPDLTRATTFAMAEASIVRDVGAGVRAGEFYPRYSHPLGRFFEGQVAALEGADGAVAFSSGMAAFHGVFCGLLGQGDVLVSSEQIYGGVHALLAHDLPRFGIEVVYVDPFDRASLRRTLADHAGSRILVHVETPVNPTVRVLDIAGLSEITRGAGALLSVDGTFLPPPFQRPLGLGADLVVHSATKFLGGHSDALGGIVSSRHELLGPLERFRRRTGGVLAPDTAWLYCRSLQTLEVRVRAQAGTAARLANWLDERRGGGGPIVDVHYPGLPNHPDHETAARQMDTFGAVLLFELSDLECATRVYDRFRKIARAVSLGGVESVASIPLHTSHASNTPEQLARAGIRPGMIRISVGLEPYEELRADLEWATSNATSIG